MQCLATSDRGALHNQRNRRARAARSALSRGDQGQKVESLKIGRLCSAEFRIFLFSARLHEARGRPQEAERDVRALLDFVRENRARVQDIAGICLNVMHQAIRHLKFLDPELGDQDLVKSWAGKLAQLRGG